MRKIGQMDDRPGPAVLFEVKKGVDEGLAEMPLPLLLVEMVEVIDGGLDLVDDDFLNSDDDAVGPPLEGDFSFGHRNGAGKRVFGKIFLFLLGLEGAVELRAHLHGLLVVNAVIDVPFPQQKIHQLMDGQGEITLLKAHSSLFPSRPLAPFRKLHASMTFLPSS